MLWTPEIAAASVSRVKGLILENLAAGRADTHPHYAAADLNILDQLERRTSRPADFEAENAILGVLADELAERPANLLQRLSDILVERGLADTAGISLRESSDNGDVCRWVALAGGWSYLKGGETPFDASPCGVVIRDNAALLVERPDRYFPRAANVPLIHEVLLVPFQSGGVPVGALFMAAHSPARRFDEEDLRLLRSLVRFAAASRQVTEALKDARGDEQASQAALAADLAGLNRLHELYAKLAVETDLDTALRDITAAAVELTGTDRGVLQRVSEDGERLEFAVHHGYGEGTRFTEHFRYQGAKAVCEAAREHQQAIVVEDTAAFPGLVGTVDLEIALAEEIRATLSFPMVTRTGELIGVLNTQFRKPHRPLDRELRFMEMLAWTATGFIERHSAADAALRDSETRFRELGAASSDVIWIRDAGTLALEYLSPAFDAVYGARRQPYAETDPSAILSLIYPGDRAGYLANFERLRAGERVRHEFRITRPSDGETRWIRNTDFPMVDDKGRVTRLGGIAQDVTEEKANAARLGVLVAELQHRVRNMLAVVRSVFARTVEANGPIEEIAAHFTGRLDALARTQMIVTQSSSGHVDLQNLIRDELLSVAVSDGPALAIEGPDVTLPPKTAESIGLALHELTTNAVKYGALSIPGAKLDIRWTVNRSDDGGRRLDLRWTEQGVSMVPLRQTREGFGRELIEDALPYRLGAKTRLEFTGGGVRCAISVPLPEDGALAPFASATL